MIGLSTSNTGCKHDRFVNKQYRLLTLWVFVNNSTGCQNDLGVLHSVYQEIDQHHDTVYIRRLISIMTQCKSRD